MKTEDPPEHKELWLIEDNRDYRDTLREGLELEFGRPIRAFATEKKVYDALERLETTKMEPPALVICDLQVTYDYPGGTAKPRYEFRQAGVRMWKSFRASANFPVKTVPWIYHSVHDMKTKASANDARTYYSPKDDGFEGVYKVVREAFPEIDEPWKETDQEETQRLLQSPQLRQRLLDAFQTPLSDCSDSLE